LRKLFKNERKQTWETDEDVGSRSKQGLGIGGGFFEGAILEFKDGQRGIRDLLADRDVSGKDGRDGFRSKFGEFREHEMEKG